MVTEIAKLLDGKSVSSYWVKKTKDYFRKAIRK